MADVKYTVVKRDTLSEIAVRYGTTVANLVKLNNIPDPDYIVVGQVLIISGTATKSATNTTSKASIKVFGLQANTDRTMYATWNWDKDKTENYHVKWYYDTGNGVWFIGNDSKVTDKQSVYTAPNNAKRVKFIVKPIAKSSNTNGSTSAPWTAGWSTAKTYDFSNNPPKVPPTPSVKMEKYKLTAELANLDVNATNIQFQIVRDDSSVYKTGNAAIKTNSASYSCTVSAGGKYKVRCRSYKGNVYSEWSAYSSNIETIPAASSGITTIRANSKTSVYLEWAAAGAAKTYDIEYATKKEYFDGTNQTSTVTNIEFTHYELVGLEMGYEYFFRVRAANPNGTSTWSAIKSVVVGRDPGPPTTWSSSTTVVVGEPLNLYWVHNSEDGSSQTYAELEVYIDGEKQLIPPIKNSTDEDEKDKTSVYSIDTTEYSEGVTIEWRVRTAGVTLTYGDWSVQRSINVYAPPTLELNLTNQNGEEIDILETFPLFVKGLAGPNSEEHHPVGYYLTVTSKESYETIDQIGNAKIVNANEKVYSKFFDTSDPLLVELSANNIDLENNIQYTVSCLVSMSSGLTAESSKDFTVSWMDLEYEPNAEIGIDEDTLSAFIRPYCDDVDGNPIADIMLSVYRREYDGRFVELATEIDNGNGTFITDPHPSLDYARYRIVAVSKTNGAVSYCDLAGYPVNCKAAVIQWDETWSNFDVSSEDALEQKPWSGSMLKLPYNITISDSGRPDVSLVEYIGRENPVAYYGTQRGESSNWGMVIDREDKETLYALRRLKIWMGDAYVREPSGSGYWAHVEVSFNQSYDNLTIPITLSITRVEGGV